jgi:hypothetical protein
MKASAQQLLLKVCPTEGISPNVPESTAITTYINWLLLGQLASHLSREEPTTLHDLYKEMIKFAKSDEDHKRRVEIRRPMRRPMRQSAAKCDGNQGWQPPN